MWWNWIASIQHWFSAFRFPKGARYRYYLYFTRWSAYLGSRETILLYQLETKAFLRYSIINSIEGRSSNQHWEIPSSVLTDTLNWLRAESSVQPSAQGYFIRFYHDPVNVRLFAYDPETKWIFSLSGSGVERTEARQFIGDVAERLLNIVDELQSQL